MNAFVQILIELSVRLARFVIRNFRAIFGLALGAGIGLAIGVSLARFGNASRGMVLMAVIIGALVVAPEIIAYLNKLSPRK